MSLHATGGRGGGDGLLKKPLAHIGRHLTAHNSTLYQGTSRRPLQARASAFIAAAEPSAVAGAASQAAAPTAAAASQAASRASLPADAGRASPMSIPGTPQLWLASEAGSWLASPEAQRAPPAGALPPDEPPSAPGSPLQNSPPGRAWQPGSGQPEPAGSSPHSMRGVGEQPTGQSEAERRTPLHSRGPPAGRSLDGPGLPSSRGAPAGTAAQPVAPHAIVRLPPSPGSSGAAARGTPEDGGGTVWDEIRRRQRTAQQHEGHEDEGLGAGPTVILRRSSSKFAAPDPAHAAEEAGFADSEGIACSRAHDAEHCEAEQLVLMRPSAAFLTNWNAHTSFHKRRRRKEQEAEDTAEKRRWELVQCVHCKLCAGRALPDTQATMSLV